MDIRKVGIVGAGTMGNGIAHVFARGGFGVTLCDVEPRFLERALATIAKNLEREVAKQKIVNERGIYDSEDQGIRSYMRFRVAFERGIGAFDLEPNKNENEQIYVEGKRI